LQNPKRKPEGLISRKGQIRKNILRKAKVRSREVLPPPILVNIHCNWHVSAATPSVGDLLYELKLLSNFYII
jgi:hypothetical protein